MAASPVRDVAACWDIARELLSVKCLLGPGAAATPTRAHPGIEDRGAAKQFPTTSLNLVRTGTIRG
ncbi:hypothetical protein GCM10009578_065310 [Streptomyces rhizosphaericus]